MKYGILVRVECIDWPYEFLDAARMSSSSRKLPQKRKTCIAVRQRMNEASTHTHTHKIHEFVDKNGAC